MASIPSNFQELKFPYVRDSNPKCGICWEPGSPERSLFDTHTATLPDSTEHHLACQTCIVRCLTTEDLLIQKVFTCHMCRKEIPVESTSAEALGIPVYRLPLNILHFASTDHPKTPTIRAVESLYTRMRQEPDSRVQVRLPKLDAITRLLLHSPSTFK